MSSPVSRRISTVPAARNSADTSISTSDKGAASTIGSKPITSTPAKLTAIAVAVRQAKRSPSHHHASSAAIGT